MNILFLRRLPALTTGLCLLSGCTSAPLQSTNHVPTQHPYWEHQTIQYTNSTQPIILAVVNEAPEVIRMKQENWTLVGWSPRPPGIEDSPTNTAPVVDITFKRPYQR